MEYENTGPQDCVGSDCMLAASSTLHHPRCVSGPSGCTRAILLRAEESGFHDQTLIAATQAINKILEGIPMHPEGLKLSFTLTRMGIFLLWVEHGGIVPPDAVTMDMDNATIAAALRLIDWE